jgi:hypothetical protein
MRLAFICSLIAMALCLAVPQARADWQYTNWGMTKEEVIAASQAAAAADKDPNPARIAAPPTPQNLGRWAGGKGEQPDLVAFYQMDEFLFTTLFYFDQDGLKSVHMMLNNANLGSTLHLNLQQRWGISPSSKSDPIVTREEWRMKEDWITFAILGSGNSDEDLVALTYWRPGSLK